MAVEDNLKSSFNVHAEITTYPVADNITIGSGDLLKIISVDGKDYVTNNTADEETVDAIAINTGSSGDLIQCYIFFYREKYKNLIGVPYIVLSQFTYKELRTLNIQNYISNSCDSISKIPCDLISKYSCDNLNKFGVRNK